MKSHYYQETVRREIYGWIVHFGVNNYLYHKNWIKFAQFLLRGSLGMISRRLLRIKILQALYARNGKMEYDEQAEHKIEVYKQNGIDGLFLTENCFRGDWPGRIMGGIEGILKNRLNRFYNRKHKRTWFFPVYLFSELEVLWILG